MVPFASILLVDDATPFAQVTAARLQRDGYDCHTATGAEEALRSLRRQRYDLLITDVEFGGERNLALVEQARQVAPGLSAIIVTETPCLETALASVELPVIAYLKKRVPYGQLRQKVETALAGTEPRRRLRDLGERLRQCAGELDDLPLSGTRVGHHGTPTRIPLATLQGVAGCLGELVAMEGGCRPDQQVTRICELLQCPVWRVHRNVVHKAVLLLNETKRRFKSKELAQVREMLEDLLQTLR